MRSTPWSNLKSWRQCPFEGEQETFGLVLLYRGPMLTTFHNNAFP